MVYVTKEELKQQSQVVLKDFGFDNDGDFDNFLDKVIAQAQSRVEGYCRVPKGFFEDGGFTVTDELCDVIGVIVDLKNRPVLEISKVEVNISPPGFLSSWRELAAEDYIPQLSIGLLHLVNCLPAREVNGVRVSYIAGFTQTPDTIKAATLDLAANILHIIIQRKVNPVVRVDDWSVKVALPDAFTLQLKQQLAPFIRRLH